MKKSTDKTIQGCADACRGVSYMFVVERSNAPSPGMCWCQTSAKLNGTCSDEHNENFNLYKLNKGRNRNEGTLFREKN